MAHMTRQKFLEGLRRVSIHPQFSYHMNLFGTIRIRRNSYDNEESITCCPLTAVCYNEGAGLFPIYAYRKAGEALGLDSQEAAQIAISSDNVSLSDPVLRDEIISILEIGKEASTPR